MNKKPKHNGTNTYGAPIEPDIPDRLVNNEPGDDAVLNGPPPITEFNTFRGLDEDGVSICVDRLSPVPSRVFISVKPEFWKSPIRVICVKLWSLASAMNSALDIMQQERNQVIAECDRQEQQIKQLSREKAELMVMFQKQIAIANEKASARAEEIVTLRAQKK